MPRRRACARAAALAAPLLAASCLLAGCGSDEALPAPCNSTSSSLAATGAGAAEVDVYFGCGCFWHVQHGFVLTEMSELCRQGSNITARAAYAGGTRVGGGGMVCYHNMRGEADYGSLGHAEVVSLRVPKASFGAFAAVFWSLCPGGDRQDPQDFGGEYRTVVGLPGGMDSSLLDELRKAGTGSVTLVPGKGNEGDTLGTRTVLVYDEQAFPAHPAEKYHQFHDDMLQSYGGAYNSLSRFAQRTQCPGDSNVVFS